MSPALKVAIIINNYLHDVATAMLLSSALVLWLLAKLATSQGPGAREWLARAYPSLTRVAKFSVVWILLGGIPRTVYFQQIEWNLNDPSNKYLLGGLAVKHVLMFTAVIAGLLMWRRVRSLIFAGSVQQHGIEED